MVTKGSVYLTFGTHLLPPLQSRLQGQSAQSQPSSLTVLLVTLSDSHLQAYILSDCTMFLLLPSLCMQSQILRSQHGTWALEILKSECNTQDHT